MSTTTGRNGQDDDERYSAPDRLGEVLANAGFEPDFVAQMVDMASVGITALWWRNTKVEDWHAGTDVGALSDLDMYRIKPHTTAKVNDRLRAWCRQQGIRAMTDIAHADRDSLETVVHNLYRWFTNPKRVLITGKTLYEVIDRTFGQRPCSPRLPGPRRRHAGDRSS